MRFSIVTVCLNPGDDLDLTVQSILSQSLGDFELLIKDGGSSDGTQERVWSDQRVRFVSAKDSGIYQAMNQALAVCSGEYICFMNAGDTFAGYDVLEEVARKIEEDTRAEFFYVDVYKPGARAGINTFPECLTRYYLFNNTICHQCWFVRRHTYLRYGGFDERYSSIADYQLMLKILARDRVPYRHVSRVGVTYKGGGHSSRPDVIKMSRKLLHAVKVEFFSRKERILYSTVWGIRCGLKFLFYDHILWRPWRRIMDRRMRCLTRDGRTVPLAR